MCSGARDCTSITATMMMHYSTTRYAGLDMPENQRSYLYTHMAHSNETIYQTPFAEDDNAYEVEVRKGGVKYTLPLHIGFSVYQYAKLRMLQFYYDFIDRYIKRPLFQYDEMDTKSVHSQECL